MSAIQTMISIRNIIGDLLHKVGVNLPSSLASLITRSSDHNNEKHSLLSTGGDSAAASILSSASSKVNAALLIRGLALSLPLLIPMANQIRRMSTDSGVLSAPQPPSSSSSSFTSASQSLSASLPTSSLMVPPFQLPQFDPYGYDRALHRRRGKRSITATTLSESTQRMLRLREQQQILRYLRQMEEMYGIQPTYAQQQPQQQQSLRAASNSISVHGGLQTRNGSIPLTNGISSSPSNQHHFNSSHHRMVIDSDTATAANCIPNSLSSHSFSCMLGHKTCSSSNNNNSQQLGSSSPSSSSSKKSLRKSIRRVESNSSAASLSGSNKNPNGGNNSTNMNSLGQGQPNRFLPSLFTPPTQYYLGTIHQMLFNQATSPSSSKQRHWRM